MVAILEVSRLYLGGSSGGDGRIINTEDEILQTLSTGIAKLSHQVI